MARKKKEPTVDIFYFDVNGHKIGVKDFTILKTFEINGLTFHLAKKGDYYPVCYAYGGCFYSVWRLDEKTTVGTPEAAETQFREGFEKNNITIDDVEFFIRDPYKYAVKKKLKKIK